MFSDALLAANKYYYKSRYNSRNKEQKDKDKLSANIKKCTAHKEEEKRQKQLVAQLKCEEFIVIRNQKTLNGIQKKKEIKITNKSVIEDAVDKNNTAVTRDEPDQPDQDDYDGDPHKASPFYEKVLEKCVNLSEEPKFPTKSNAAIKKLNSTGEIVKNALCRENVSVCHKRGRKEYDRTDNEKDLSSQQKYEPYEKIHDKKPEKPKEKKRLTSQMDFHQTLMLAKKNKGEPIAMAAEYVEEKAWRKRIQEKMEAEKSGYGKVLKFNKSENEKKLELNVIDRVQKLSDKYHFKQLHYQVKSNEKEKNRSALDKEKSKEIGDSNVLKYEHKKERKNMESIEKHKSENENIVCKYSTASNIGDRKQIKVYVSHEKSVCKEQRNCSGDELSKINQNMHIGYESLKNNDMDKSDCPKESQGNKEIPFVRFEDNKLKAKSFARSSQPKITNSFNFDKYISSIKRKSKPDDLKKKKRQIFDSQSGMEDYTDNEI